MIHCIKKDRIVKESFERFRWENVLIYFSPNYNRWIVTADDHLGYQTIWDLESTYRYWVDGSGFPMTALSPERH